MKIASIGGSDSVINGSFIYTFKKVENISINNKGIGGTNSLHGMINIIKYKLIENYDCLFHSYFNNDNNHCVNGLFTNQNIILIKKSLIMTISMCLQYKTKLLFILFYDKTKINEIKESSTYQLYKSLIDEYNIPYIDAYDILYTKYGNNWTQYYRDNKHLSTEGYFVISQEIKNILSRLPVLEYYGINKYIKPDNYYNCIMISKYLKNIVNIKNSLINVDYFQVDNSIHFIFNKPCRILAIEYIADNYSGYITIKTDENNIIQKNTQKNIDENLTYLCKTLCFYTNKFKLSSIYSIEMSSFTELNDISYDIDYSHCITKQDITNNIVKENTNFKLVSLLINNDAEILQIK